ncbi:hypothetical protein OBBRIDRAFT_459500 [Obba rivulosa]|uniref:Uncharacterized protein n=1 Tax=Obba rivulosa TaxID=1052685 RepID=A0A8E2DM49_9APHY|nr:hypothetical protein OBBRIDRAFT_459500 [Obba rivulosa]
MARPLTFTSFPRLRRGYLRGENVERGVLAPSGKCLLIIRVALRTCHGLPVASRRSHLRLRLGVFVSPPFQMVESAARRAPDLPLRVPSF